MKGGHEIVKDGHEILKGVQEIVTISIHDIIHKII